MTGNKALRDKLLAMSPEEVKAFWAAEQERKREAGEAYYRTLYAAVTGPQANVVLARVD